MKYIIITLLVLAGFAAKAQLPSSTFPSRIFNGNTKAQWLILDSPVVNPILDTFNARYPGTQLVRIQGGDTAFWFGAGGHLWFRPLLNRDTISLSNRINLKLNISDTTGKWLAQSTRLVDTIYRVNDSTVGYTIKGAPYTFQILGSAQGGGGGSGLTSVGLSMPSAFSVSGSPLTSNGTISVSGAGASTQYIRGNGTLATTDTGMIPNFYLKVRSLFSGTSPITYNSTTGAIGINNANVTGTKGAASFTSQFSDNGSGLIDLADLVSAGSCTGCVLNINAKGRITSYSDGAGGGINNTNIGSGFRPVNVVTQEMRTYFAGFGQRLDSVANANGLTWSSDTTRGSGLPTYYYIDSLPSENISNTSLTANGNYTQNWSNKQWYVDSIAGQFLFRMGGIGSSGTRRKEFRINWGGSSFGDNLDGFNILASIKKADLSADSLTMGLTSSGTGVLSMGTYDIANSANNTFISYNVNAGLINISAKDSIWIKGAVPAATADSILGVTFRSPGVSKIVKIPLSAAGGGGATLNNIGSGLRWVATPGGNIKTVFESNTVLWDSTSNSNALTAKVDTSVIATQYDLTQLISADTTLSGILNGYADAEQEANNQTYAWSLISNDTRSQWYDGVSTAEYKDTLIMFGGWNASVSYDSVFHSADNGVTWIFRSLLPYAVHTPAVINSSDGWTYVVGGDYLNNNTQRATVYRTKDFRTYETRTTTSPFGDRVLHAGVEFNGDLYVGGGQFYTLNAADGLFPDLYKSSDGGVTWSLYSSSFPGGKNISGCFRVFNGRMYIVSGGIYDNNPANKTFERSTFASVNGIDWTTVDSIPYQGMQYPNTFVWDGKLWLSGGFGGTSLANLDSTAYMDKSGVWHKYKPSQKAAASHAAGTYVFKDRAYQILGNGVNQVWQLQRGTDIWFENGPYFKTAIRIDSLRRNEDGYNIDAHSTTAIVENRYTNTDAVNYEKWSGSEFQLFNNGVLNWKFPGSGMFYAKNLLASNSSTTFYSGAYYSTTLQTSENFPGVAWTGASERFVLGLDGSLVGFRRENGATNGIRMKHDISNGKTVIAQNTTNDYDVAIVPSAALALLSTTSGFMPPAMTATQRSAITVGRISSVSITNSGSGYTNGTYSPVSLNSGSGTSATASITISGSVISSVTIINKGSNYVVGDILTVTAGDVGGTGSGAQITVTTIQETGLTVFDTDSARESIYNGTAWKMVAWTSDIAAAGNTMYTGDGTLAGNRAVTGSNNSLTFDGIFNFRVNANSFLQSKTGGGATYSTSVVGASNYLHFGYTPTPTVYSKGIAMTIDTNNNVGFGVQPPTTIPLYSTGVNTYVASLMAGGGVYNGVTDITSNTTLSQGTYYHRIDATAGNVTITLPAASAAFGSSIGIHYIFKRMDNSGNTITIQRAGSDTIDGGTSITLTTQYEVKELQCSSATTWDVR